MTATGKLKLLKNNALNTFSTVAIGGVSSPLDRFVDVENLQLRTNIRI